MRKILLGLARLVSLGVLAFVALIVVFLIRSDDPDLATEAPLISSGTAGTPIPAPTVDLPAGVRRFVIDPAASNAKYVVKETLRLIDATRRRRDLRHQRRDLPLGRRPLYRRRIDLQGRLA